MHGNVDRIDVSLIPDPNAALELYAHGKLDILEVTFSPSPDLDRLRRVRVDDYLTGPMLVTESAGSRKMSLHTPSSRATRKASIEMLLVGESRNVTVGMAIT